MKLRIEGEEAVLTVSTTKGEDETVELVFPNKLLYNWYPFNVNFSYKHSHAKDQLYLVKDITYDGENFYKAETLKKSKPLKTRNGVPFHPYVFRRNLHIINLATFLGIPTIKDRFNEHKVEQGFFILGDLINDLKESIEERIEEETGIILSPDILNESQDKEVYNKITEDELKELQEFGEIYGMLTIMRKLCEGS